MLAPVILYAAVLELFNLDTTAYSRVALERS